MRVVFLISFGVFILLSIIPVYSQKKLIASDGKKEDSFGIDVAISNKGKYVFVGAYRTDRATVNEGSVYYFKKDNETGDWIEEQKVIAPDTPARLGFRTVTDPSGKYFFAGTSESMYEFRENNGQFVFSEKIEPDDKNNFGQAFASSIDVTTKLDYIVVGANLDMEKRDFAGAAYIFSQENEVWNQDQKLYANPPIRGGNFGTSVGIDEGGRFLAVGASGINIDGNVTLGDVTIFKKSDTTWVLDTIFAESGQNFGRAISMSDDGKWVVAGAEYDDTFLEDAGSLYVYYHTGTEWQRQAHLKPFPLVGETLLGRTVAIDSAGLNIVATGLGEPGDLGAVYHYKRIGDVWVPMHKLTVDVSGGNIFGNAIDISPDGSHVIVGHSIDSPNSVFGAGSAYIWNLENLTATKIKLPAEIEVNAFPNPAKNVLDFSFPTPTKTTLQLQLFNNHGTLLQEAKIPIQSKTFNLPFSHSKNEVLFWVIRTPQGQVVKQGKVVVME